MSKDLQQVIIKKILLVIIINIDQRRNQNSINKDMIKKWASEKSFDTRYYSVNENNNKKQKNLSKNY